MLIAYRIDVNSTAEIPLTTQTLNEIKPGGTASDCWLNNLRLTRFGVEIVERFLRECAPSLFYVMYSAGY